MKNKFVYIIILFLFMALTISLTITYLFIHQENRGNVKVNKDYYEIVFSNVSMNDDFSVKINNNVIMVSIDDINELIEPKTFYVDITNIGSLNARVDGMYISNVSSNDLKNYVNVETSVVKDDVIKGSEMRKLKVKISYNGVSQDKIGYKFNINYLFKELSL